MSQVRDNKRQFYYDVDEPPEKKLISDGDILVKKLFEKQQNTKINLHEQLLKPKQFEKSTFIEPVTNHINGIGDLKTFQATASHCGQIENLKQAGLTSEDITLYFESKNDFETVLKKHKNLDKTVLKQRLAEIAKAIEGSASSAPKQNKLILNRHKTEFALSIKPNSTETKLLKFALENEKNHEASIPHPMDAIKKIETQLFCNVSSEVLDPKKIQKKARSLGNKICNRQQPVMKTSEDKHTTKWDLQTPEIIKTKIVEKKQYSCAPQSFYTIKNGAIIKVDDLNKIPVISDVKLTVEEILKIPKFENYKVGEATHTLYVKNLSAKVNEEVLKTLFSKCDFVEVRLMRGKMRGQAFITFSNVEEATEALYKVNGTVVDGKPVVIQFGKANTK